MHRNNSKFEGNSSLEFYHMTYIGKTKHTSLRRLLWRAPPFACCSRVTSRVSPKWRACLQANLNVTFLRSNCTFFHDLVTSCSVKQITNWLQWIKQDNSGVISSIQLMKRNSLSCERRNFQTNKRTTLVLGYVRTIPDSFCSGTKTIPYRTSVRT